MTTPTTDRLKAEFDEICCTANHDDLKSFIFGKDGVVETVRRDVDSKISTLLNEFARTPIDKRGNGWDWLLKLRASLSTPIKKPNL